MHEDEQSSVQGASGAPSSMHTQVVMAKTSTVGGILGLEALFVLLWNTGFIGSEYGLPYAGPFSFLFWRYGGLTGVLAVWLAATRGFVWPGSTAAAHIGLVGLLAHGVWLTCVLVALDMNVPAGTVALVTALQPMLTGALAGLALGKRTSLIQWAGLALGFGGVVVAVGARMSLDSAAPPWAYMIPFGSVVGITAASLLQRRREQAGRSNALPLSASLFYQSGATALALALPAWLVEGFATRWEPPFIAALGWVVLVVSLGAYWTMWRLLVHQEATRVASLFYLSPPVTMIMAWVAFRDELLLTDVIGLAVAGLGVFLVYRAAGNR